MVTVDIEDRLHKLLRESSDVYTRHNRGRHIYVGEMKDVAALFAKKLASKQPLLTIEEMAILNQLERDNPVLKITSDSVALYLLRVTQAHSLSELAIDRLGVSGSDVLGVNSAIQIPDPAMSSDTMADIGTESRTYSWQNRPRASDGRTGTLKQNTLVSSNTLAKRYEERKRDLSRETHGAGAVKEKPASEGQNDFLVLISNLLLRKSCQIYHRLYNGTKNCISLIRRVPESPNFKSTSAMEMSFKEWTLRMLTITMCCIFFLNAIRMIYFMSISTIYNMCRAYMCAYDESSVIKVQGWKVIQILEYGAYLLNSWLEEMMDQ